MSAAEAGTIAKRGRMKRRMRAGFRSYDHGQPIKTIDTRPMAFVFGLVALVMLLSASPPRTNALLIDLLWDDRAYLPPNYQSTFPPSAVLTIRIDDRRQISINDQPTTLSDFPNQLRTRLENEKRPLVNFAPAPDASYEKVLLVLSKLESQGLTGAYRFCFGELQKYREFEAARGGALAILLTLDIPEHNHEFYEACFGPEIPLPS